MRGWKSKEFLELRYNVLKMQFEPDKTFQLANFIKNMVDHQGIAYKYEYNNLLVQLFADKLEGTSAKERADICGKIYTMMFLNF